MSKLASAVDAFQQHRSHETQSTRKHHSKWLSLVAVAVPCMHACTAHKASQFTTIRQLP